MTGHNSLSDLTTNLKTKPANSSNIVFRGLLISLFKNSCRVLTSVFSYGILSTPINNKFNSMRLKEASGLKAENIPSRNQKRNENEFIRQRRELLLLYGVDRFNSWSMAQFVHFTALLVLCGTGDSLETTTSPQQQNTGDTKDFSEVQSWISLNRLLMDCNDILHDLQFSLGFKHKKHVSLVPNLGWTLK